MLATPDLITEAAMSHRLGEVLPRYVRDTPLYAGRDLAVSNSGGICMEVFRSWPVITKQDIRLNFPANFLGPNTSLDSLKSEVELESTSGTGAEGRIPLLLGRGWWAKQERRALRLNSTVAACLDADPHDRRVTIASPSCNNDICFTGVPSHDQRIVGSALFVSLSRFPFMWSRRDLARMVEETVDWSPLFLDVDPVYAVAFALHCEREAVRFPSLRFVLASYEFVSVNHRRVLERVFGVPVLNLYGSTETGHLAMEVADGLLRPSLETAYLELLSPDAGGVGELLVTTLTNSYMPLVRYRIGDLARRIDSPAGSRFVIHGRVADSLRKPDGTRLTVWQLDQCFADLPGFAHYQLTEPQHRSFLLRYVPDNQPPAPDNVEDLRERLAVALGPGASLAIESSDIILPTRSGKFRLCYPAE